MQLVRMSVTAGVAAALGCLALPARAYKVDATGRTIAVVSLTDFDKCALDYGGGDGCLDALKTYVNKQPKAAFAAGKRARLNYQHWVALGFFAKAFSKAAPAEQCADEDVAMAVVSGLSMASDSPQVATARRIADQCWEQIQPKLVSELQGDTSNYRIHACKMFGEKKVTPTECQPPKPEPKKPAGPTAGDLLKGVQWKQLATDPESARVFRSQRGHELLMLRTKPGRQDFVLLKFKGITGPWNGQVLVALERFDGRTTDYVTLGDQREWAVLTEREGQYEAYPKGVQGSIAFYEVALERGLKDRPTPGDVTSEFGSGAKPAPAATAKQ